MAVGDAGFEMDPRLDYRFAPALRAKARLDRSQYFGVGNPKLVDVETIEIGNVDRGHRRSPEAKTICIYIIEVTLKVNVSPRTVVLPLRARAGVLGTPGSGHQLIAVIVMALLSAPQLEIKQANGISVRKLR